jgi:ABC-type nitrate/sulfonate/bicarbonate transport system permease component
MYAGIIAMSLLGLMLYVAISHLEKKTSPHRSGME